MQRGAGLDVDLLDGEVVERRNIIAPEVVPSFVELG